MTDKPKSDIEIARAAKMRPIIELGRERLGLKAEDLEPYGHYKAKLSLSVMDQVKGRPDGKLILVTAITPTPAGEGKTTTTVGLGDGLNRIGKKAMICLREPSLGPCFGVKGGAAGGGYAQVVPMEDINLHFTGDFHAIGSAHNLLAALLDNHIYWGNELGIDARRVTWRRVMDMNDRALRADRQLARRRRQRLPARGRVRHHGGLRGHGDLLPGDEPRGPAATASATSSSATTRDRKPIFARDLKADGAMTVLLKDAITPNLVQTLENNPAFIHGGPFANIAHGCNSVLATKTALKLADYVVTEAGFGADLGAEKFIDIKCRKAGLKPAAAVMVATVRALKMHGGVAKEDLGKENVEAVKKGVANLARHVENVGHFGVPAVVAINRFIADTDAELRAVEQLCAELGVEAIECTHWAEGGKGTEKLARHVVELAESGRSNFRTLYPDDMPLWDKVRTIAQRLYRRPRDHRRPEGARPVQGAAEDGYGNYPGLHRQDAVQLLHRSRT